MLRGVSTSVCARACVCVCARQRLEFWVSLRSLSRSYIERVQLVYISGGSDVVTVGVRVLFYVVRLSNYFHLTFSFEINLRGSPTPVLQ